MCAARGVGLDIIAEMVERAEGTVREWLSEWRRYRMGPRGDRSRRGRERGEAQAGAEGRSWRRFSVDRRRRRASRPVSGTSRPLEDVVQIKFGVEYRSESSYRLLMRFLGMSFKLPDPFDKRRDEKAIARRMAEIRRQVNDLLQEGWEVYTVDEVRVAHEAETRRMWLPKGKRTKLYVDRKKAS